MVLAVFNKGSLERSGHGPGAKFGNMTLGSEYASNTLADNQYDDINIPFWNRPAGLQPIVRAWYENLNNVASKTPGLSSKLPPAVNDGMSLCHKQEAVVGSL